MISVDKSNTTGEDEALAEYVLVSAAIVRAAEIGRDVAEKQGYFKRYTCFNCGNPTGQPATAFEAFGRHWRFPSCCLTCALLDDDPWRKSAIEA